MRTLALALLLFILPFAQSSAHAQSTEAAIKARLMNQPLYLRGFWSNNKLHFDSAGNLQGNSKTESFTLSGFELEKAELKANGLILGGNRIGLELEGPPKRVRIEKIQIEIDAPPNGDYTEALDAVFANGLDEIVPSLPDYWKGYATRNFLPDDTPSPTSAPTTASVSRSESRPLHLPAQGVVPPKLLHSVEPKFNGIDRNLRYSGNVLINLWITPDGKVTHLSIARPIGMGLDEEALAAVAQYTFSPAMQNGKPVLVELKAQVKFELF